MTAVLIDVYRAYQSQDRYDRADVVQRRSVAAFPGYCHGVFTLQ